MKTVRRWPLSRRILLLGLGNVAGAAVVFTVFARVQFGLAPEALLIGPSRDHLVAIASNFRSDLEIASDKDALFAVYARRYNAEVFLVNPEGIALAGPAVSVPPPVIERIRAGGAPPPPPPPPGQDPERKGPPRPFQPRKGVPPPPPREPFTFAVTHEPLYYWAMVRMPYLAPGGELLPGIFILRTNTLWNSQIFFRWAPWLWVMAALIAVTVACWVPFLRGITRSIRDMDRVTAGIAQGRFDARVSEARGDELGDLGTQINTLAARLESFVNSQKRYLGDIAHELSAPIARIQFALGILEQRAARTSAHESDINALHEEVQEMSALVNELLSFSKAGLSASSPVREPVAVAPLVRRAAARELVAAHIDIDESLAALAQPEHLLRAVANLLRNAERYAGKDGPIAVTARPEEGGRKVVISVCDSGPGLPEESLAQIFEPFFRPQASRSRDTGGVGLGLAIVKSCVDACKGTVVCRNRSPRGLEVAITLDSAPPIAATMNG